jgi:hypothetical protein
MVNERLEASVQSAQNTAPQPELKIPPAPMSEEIEATMSTEERAHRAKIFVNHARDLQNA